MTTKTLPTARALAPVIAAALGGYIVPPTDDESCGWAAIVARGVPLYLSVDSYRKRLNVGVHWPRYKDGRGGQETVRPGIFLPYDERQAEPVTSISCDPFRDPQKIAADIARRLLPQATDLYARALGWMRDRQSHAERRLSIAARFVEGFGMTLSKDGDVAVYGRGLPDLCVYGYLGDNKGVSFQSFSTDVETALKVLAVIRDSKKGSA